MKILILGGNGFIGSEIARVACLDGHHVSCMGRNIKAAKSRLPAVNWISQDIAKLDDKTDWNKFIESYDAIINCAGALQQSLQDNVAGTQEKSMLALYKASISNPKIQIVQISTNTMVGTTAGETDFLKTKMTADIALTSSDIKHTILRPALVIGRNAYGGTAFLKAVSAFPIFVPLSFPNSICQITNLDELAQIALNAAKGEYGSAGDYSVSASEKVSLKELTLKLRTWLGFSYAPLVEVARPIAIITSKLADIAGLLGWRSPIRSTAMKVLENDIITDTSKPLLETASLDKTLLQYNASVQDKWFARFYLLKPFFILVLSIFWLASGLIALSNIESAQSYLTPIGFEDNTTRFLIIITAIADCILGLTVLFRKYAQLALLGMCLLSLGYLTGATLFIPQLWLDPIGPLVKVIPSIFLGLACLVLLDER
jgi:nucleoside-diphosphate-sugar epimerase